MRRQDGFTLIETVFALAIMAGGLLSLAAVFSYGLMHLHSGSSVLVAKEKAAEAIESVFMSRDSQVVRWAQVRNQSDGGIFVNGAVAIYEPGPDGLVNTSDDALLETVTLPGPDGLVGTPDDVLEPLAGYTREIRITDISPNLREIRVIVTYPFGNGNRQFELMTYISAFA